MTFAFLRRVGFFFAASTATAAVGGACSSETTQTGAVDAGNGEAFKATVRRTSAGVPHVKADDFGGLGYGYGYVFAEDNVCVLAEEIVTSRGERAKFFGDAPYDLGNTSSKSNVGSDAVYKMLVTNEVIDKLRASVDADGQATVRGFAAGISRYVRELKAGQHEGRHVACRNEPWLREVTDGDLFGRMYRLTLLASTGTLIDSIVAAAPVGATQTLREQSQSTFAMNLEKAAPKLMALRKGEVGSNMYAFGTEVTGGGGIQYGNPHFPWYGGERLYQVHLTVPGKMDVQGVSLYGVPAVLIGFNDTFGWSHTVSTAYRFTPYALTLKPGDPLTYIQDGVEKKITPVDFAIEVKGADGQVAPRNVRLYRSEYGPMVNLSALQWSADVAFTFRDANAENFRFLKQYLRWNRAKTLDEFIAIQAEEVASPWVNTTAADKNGKVYYADLSVVPNVTDALAKSCEYSLYSTVVASQAPGLALLDGSKKACDWRVDPAAAQPGAFSAADLPKVQRNDWVVNCNDSYWLTNPRAPIMGYPKIVGREEYQQSLRSRLCHQQVADRLSGADGLPGTNVTADALKQIVLSSRIYSAEKFKAAIVAGVCTSASIQLTSDPYDARPITPAIEVPIDPACATLTAWNNRNESDSKGSVLWDEIWLRVLRVTTGGTTNFNVAFDPSKPIDTPSDLDVSRPEIAQAFAGAVHSVTVAGFPVDVARSAIAWREGKGGPTDRIPIFGGYSSVGAFTVAEGSPLGKVVSGAGYGPIRRGNSYMQIVSFGAAGVDANTFVTYSLSTDPASPHYDDYTRLYAQKQWLKAAFTEAEIVADTKETLELQQ